jgi:conjugal transfer pilus assembly protein TraK
MRMKTTLTVLLAAFSLIAQAQVGLPIDQAKSAGVPVKPDAAVKAASPAPAPAPPEANRPKPAPYMPTTSHRVIEPPKGEQPKAATPVTMRKIVTTAADDPVEEPSLSVGTSSVSVVAPKNAPAVQQMVADKLGTALGATELRLAADAQAQAPLPGMQGLTGELKNDFVVRSGVTEIIKIPKNFLTRMMTPFAKPEAKSVNDVEVEVVGSTLYVTPTSDQPIGLFVYDTEDPTRAMTLQLIPQEIPQRDISLQLVGTRPGASEGRGGSGKGALGGQQGDRGTQPYTTGVVELMADMAKGRIPTGFTMAKPVGNEADCIIPGVKAVVAQLVDGQRRKVAVMILENQSNAAIEINEQACYRNGVVGVSVWPYPVIQPGQQTEAYILMNHEEQSFDSGSMRPRLVK